MVFENESLEICVVLCWGQLSFRVFFAFKIDKTVSHTQRLIDYMSFTGTLGQTLSDNPDLYISRDGGISWHETLSGSYGANVLDHGGIIVAVKDYHQVPSTQLKYTCDEGLTWNEFTFTDVGLVNDFTK